MTAVIQSVLSWLYLIISKLKRQPAPVTSQPDDHVPTIPVTVEVTVNEDKNDPEPSQVHVTVPDTTGAPVEADKN